jgi:Spy/CpxP family protein refolding chaperone
MKNRTIRISLAALMTIAIVAVGTPAMAGKKMGYKGDGQGQQQGDCRYGKRWADLTPEQRDQLETERRSFLDATKQARQDLYAKRLALKAEIAKREPDMNAARGLQKEISGIQADLDQKRLEHVMAMRKIDPDAGRGFMGQGCGRGHGGKRHHYGKGGGMGNGPENCPFD